MKEELLKKLKGIKYLDETEEIEFFSSGSYALNKIITGKYHDGIALGCCYQIRGESSTGKTLFITTILREAQKKGFYTVLVDAENAFSKEFSKLLGLDPSKLLYTTPATLEECFDEIEKIIKSIREGDAETPIVIGVDSLAVLPTKKEIEKENFDSHEMEGAQRAKTMGSCLRKINPLLKKYKVSLIVINQLRNKVGIIYGSNETNAAGGKSLEYYLAVDLKTISNKTSDVLRNENKEPIGIVGRVDCKKNRISVPFKSCDFKVDFNKGLDPYYGLLDFLVQDGYITKSANGRCQIGEYKFTSGEFLTVLFDKNIQEMAIIRQLLKIEQ